MTENNLEPGCSSALKAIEIIGDQQLGPARRARLMKHIETCPECKAYFERMTMVINALEEIPRTPAPEGFTEKVLEVIRAYIPEGDSELSEEHLSKRFWIAGAAFGVLGVTIALGLAIIKHFTEHEERHPEGKEDELASRGGAVAAAS